MKCFYCGEKIERTEDDPCYFIGLDRPYANLPFHRNKCYKDKIKDHEEEYLTENSEKIWEWSRQERSRTGTKNK